MSLDLGSFSMNVKTLSKLRLLQFVNDCLNLSQLNLQLHEKESENTQYA